MTSSSTATIDQETAERLSAAFHRCFAEFIAADGLFADDTFYDLLPPMWRFQFEGPGAVFAAQLQSIAEGPVEIEIVRTIPTATGWRSTTRAPTTSRRQGASRR